MIQGHIAELSRRGVIAIGGADAEKFLNDLVTNDVEAIPPGGAGYGGLLAPQGKILFDFIIFRDGDRFLFDLPRNRLADFAKRIAFYRLRAKVEIADLGDSHRVFAAWGGRTEPPALGIIATVDPRIRELGFRGIVAAGTPVAAPGYATASESDYDTHRIALGIPEGAIDFAYGDTFPHDADMDQLGGIAFTKGCYIGQEVISRMEHRGTARRRIVQVNAATDLPTAGTEIMAGSRPLGTMASSAGHTGLALIRLDRAKEALDAGTPLTAHDVNVEIRLPEWARFTWPVGEASRPARP